MFIFRYVTMSPRIPYWFCHLFDEISHSIHKDEYQNENPYFRESGGKVIPTNDFRLLIDQQNRPEQSELHE